MSVEDTVSACETPAGPWDRACGAVADEVSLQAGITRDLVSAARDDVAGVKTEVMTASERILKLTEALAGLRSDIARDVAAAVAAALPAPAAPRTARDEQPPAVFEDSDDETEQGEDEQRGAAYRNREFAEFIKCAGEIDTTAKLLAALEMYGESHHMRASPAEKLRELVTAHNIRSLDALQKFAKDKDGRARRRSITAFAASVKDLKR